MYSSVLFHFLIYLLISQVLSSPEQYKVVGDKLHVFGATIASLVAAGETSFKLENIVKVKPEKNLALSGLYKESATDLLCTQCEASGFRRIAFHYDRPDVLSTYTVRLEAEKAAFPLLLSNGNMVESGDVAGTTRHWAIWEDPFPKPSYLFALVAGDLGSIHDTFTTAR
jgi:aminopeptidase N